MNTHTLKRIVALGALTGMRSLAGLATLASAQRGVGRPAMALAAATEMIADKTPWIGARIDPLPLAARAIIGGSVGALIAGQHDDNVLLGGVLGAATAVVAAHVAYHVRKRLPSGVPGGLIEDGLVIALASRYRAHT